MLLLPPVRFLALVLICLAGCAHKQGPATKEEFIRDDVTRTKTFLNDIPGCSSDTGAVPLAELASADKVPPRVRGFLIRDEGVCTLMACSQECCNTCRGEWRLSAGPLGEAPLLMLLPAPSWQVMDCSLRSLPRGGTEVIVTGTIRPRDTGPDSRVLPGSPAADEIVTTSICAAR
jgi:hypothetical protein